LIAEDINSKTFDEVERYANVFWERYKELNGNWRRRCNSNRISLFSSSLQLDYEKYIGKIEKGESELEKQNEIQTQLTEKILPLRIPLQQLKIQYTQPTKGKNYTEEEDRFLLVMLEHYGYGSENVYDNIRLDIKNSPLFRFDWFMKSRTSQELSRRCNTLVGLIHKENSDVEEENKKVG
jgi:SWI/SNF-related matrix-associated actin-dependent regulator of chromatin subfamily A member 5